MRNRVIINGDALHVDLWYPRSSEIKAIEIGLMDVRAADDIRVEYDFQRDGWVIKQAQVFEFDTDDNVCDPEWIEVAFVQAWASERKSEKSSPSVVLDGTPRR